MSNLFAMVINDFRGRRVEPQPHARPPIALPHLQLGGILIPWAGWPAIFLVNVPVGVVALLGVWRIPAALDPGTVAQRPHFDLGGFLLLAGGIAATTYGTSTGVQAGWLGLAAWPYWLGDTFMLVG